MSMPQPVTATKPRLLVMSAETKVVRKGTKNGT